MTHERELAANALAMAHLKLSHLRKLADREHELAMNNATSAEALEAADFNVEMQRLEVQRLELLAAS